MVTQKEIARELGVTQQAVSHALTGGGTLSVATRERIITAATAFGYRPNSSARAMKSGRFGAVALIMGKATGSSTLPEALWSGIHNELALHNLNLVLAKLPDDALSDTAVLPKVLRELSVDGVLIDYTDHVPPRFLDSLEASGLPAVWLNIKRETDCVYPDDFGAGVAIGQHLMEAGHRRIAYVDVNHDLNDPDLHYSVYDRLAGLRAAMRPAGLEVESLFLHKLSVSETLATLRALWERPEPITAIVGYAPPVFELVCRAAWKSGREVPDDVSVAIFCDERETARMGFEMTRMKVPQEDEGEAAVKLLLRKISGDFPLVPAQSLPFIMRKGDTVGPAKI